MVELHRAAEEYGLRGEVRVGERDLDLLEKRGERHFDRAVDDDAKCPAIVVLADEGEGPGKIRVRHRRHGDEEVAGQVDRLHWPPVRLFYRTAPRATKAIGCGVPARRSAPFLFLRRTFFLRAECDVARSHPMRARDSRTIGESSWTRAQLRRAAEILTARRRSLHSCSWRSPVATTAATIRTRPTIRPIRRSPRAARTSSASRPSATRP